MGVADKIRDKVRLLVSAVYNNGVPQFREKQVIADAVISDRKPDTDIRVVSLRFAAPSGIAEGILHAFKTGEVAVLIDGVEPV